MIVTICGSMNFVAEMKKAEEELKKRGYEVLMPASINDYNLEKFEDVDKVIKNNKEEYLKRIKPRYTMHHFDKVMAGDAILVINEEKHGIKNYIGGATFAEIMLAFYGKKKIYFLNPIPEEPKMFLDELGAVNPIVLNGDFSKIV